MSDFPFVPVNTVNSISEVIVAIHFEQPLPNSILARTRELKSVFKNELPAQEDLTRFEFVSAGLNAPPPITAFGGVQLRRIKPDASVGWQLRVADNSISAHCLEYDRWTNVWPKLQEYMATALAHVAGSNVEVGAVAFQFIDRFVLKAGGKYDPSLLLKPDTPYLTPNSFRGDYRWHSFSGWYEKDEGDFEVLQQLNVTSAGGAADPISVTIDHNQLRKKTKPGELGRYRTFDKKAQFWNHLANSLHIRNKRVLSDLLSDRAQNLIGMNSNAG